MMTTGEARKANPDAYTRATYFALGVLHGLPIDERMAIYDALGVRRVPADVFAAYYVEACADVPLMEQPLVAQCFDAWLDGLRQQMRQPA